MATKAQYLYSVGEMAELVNHACNLEREREALAAENARLREALEEIKEFHEDIDLNASQSPAWSIAHKALNPPHGD